LGVGDGDAAVGGGGLGGGSILRGGREGEVGAAAVAVGDNVDAVADVVEWCAGAAGELSRFILERPDVRSFRSSSFSVLRAKQKSDT
jgi:hypothetical protein